MQAPKSRPKTLHVPQKLSPSTPPRTNRSLKATSPDSNFASSPSPISKTPKGRSSKAVDRRSPRTPATEKKRPIRVSESEPNCITQLQDELEKVKEQLASSESSKKRAQQEAEDANKKLESMISQLEQTQSQLKEISDSEEARVHELRKLSQERDKAWKSELEALQKHHSMDSAALASALSEIQRLKIQVHGLSESEASKARYAESACDEIQSLKGELMETLDLVERLKRQVNDSRESEARALDEVDRMRMMMEEAVKKSEDMSRLVQSNSTAEAYNKSLEIELGESRERVKSLEELVGKLEMDLSGSRKVNTGETDEKLEPEEHATKSESLETKLEESMAEIDSNDKNALEKESELVLENLLEKEKQLQSIKEENEKLKCKITEMETEMSKSNEALYLAEDAERETSSKIGYLTEEAARVSEQLDAAEAARSEMEAELRRLKVQSDQWRKAAEAAASMLSNNGNGVKFNDKMRSFDCNTIGGKLGLPYNEDLDDESPKKKKGNVLKNIGGLLKKGQKY